MTTIKSKTFSPKFFFKKKTFLKIWNRDSIIPYILINQTVFVYNGKIFKKIYISRDNVGYKFGEFVFTKKSPKKIKKKN